jgi:hypothetical protein
MSKEQILAAGRSETLRALARTSVTCMAYDAIADMVVKAARVIKPELEALIVNEPPSEFLEPGALIDMRVERPEAIVAVADLIDDLWSVERMKEITEHLSVILGVNAVLRHTIRGEICRGLDNDDYVLIISALAKHPDDEF